MYWELPEVFHVLINQECVEAKCGDHISQAGLSMKGALPVTPGV